jgi:hypothetical protein
MSGTISTTLTATYGLAVSPTTIVAALNVPLSVIML